MSAPERSLRNVWHPYRALPSEWRLRITRLPDGLLGLTDHSARTVTLTAGMTQAQRRSTMAHEIGHVERGPVPEHIEHIEERAVDVLAARRLIPLEQLIDAARWARCTHELAEDLWVDEATLRVRLDHLHPSERMRLVDALREREW